MDVYNRIKAICKEKGLSIRDLAKKIDMSFSGLYTAMERDTLKVNTILKIADILQVPPTYFFAGSHADIVQESFLNHLDIQVLSRRYEKFTDQLSFLKDFYIFQVLQSIYFNQIPNIKKKGSNEIEYLVNKNQMYEISELPQSIKILPYSKWDSDSQVVIKNTGILTGFYFAIFERNYLNIIQYLQDGMLPDSELISYWNEWKKK